ncbi:hypothetical protein [Halioxenophilus sp. WMMB6]|uniref:hypothetical protein n=1 Tax=Halioxenophilus sp. WMMB6 TaxID=3073815 RepID=UPI00295EDF72|nr:hypothetical protein [Halioxenophilus sp. WMMB6]
MAEICRVASNTRGLSALAVSLLFILLSACGGGGSSGGGGSGDGGDPIDSVTADFDSTGGKLSSSDGGLTLIVPEGALDTDTTITIKPISPEDLPAEFAGLGITQAYELGPSGLQFNTPVTVRFPVIDDDIDPANLQGVIGLNLYTSSDGQLEILADVTLELDEIGDTATLTGGLSHFSPVALGSRSLFDGALVEGVPHVVNVREDFTVKVRLLHGVDSTLSAEHVFYLERIDASGIWLTDDSLDQFAELQGLPGELALPFFELLAGEEKNEEQDVSYFCTSHGIFQFNARMAYFNVEGNALKPQVNAIEFFQRILCKSAEVTMGEVRLVAKSALPSEPPAQWLFSAVANTVKANVGDTFTIILQENGPFGVTDADTYVIDFVDTVPSVLSAPALSKPATLSGTTDVNFAFGGREPLMNFEFSGSVNAQRIDFTCETTGATQLAFELEVYDQLPTPTEDFVAREALLVNVSCGEDHSSVPDDSDGDGFGASEDYCLNEAGAYNGCPIVESNGELTQYCASETRCDTGVDNGSCSDCAVTGGDGWASICDADSTCSYRNDSVRECSGGCSLETDGVQASCADGAVCSVDSSLFSCESDANGEGCAISLNNGETLGCPTPGVACTLLASKIVSDLTVEAASNKFTIRALSEGGDSEFQFDWTYNDSQFPRVAMGDFPITTQNGVGTSELQLVTADAADQFIVWETPVIPFELSSVQCVPSEPVSLATDLALTTGAGETVCSFLNLSSEPPPSGVFSGPDSAIGVEECSLVDGNAFGLNSTEPLIACGGATRTVIFNPLTGTVPYAQSQRLSFDNSPTQTYGAVVWLDPQLPGEDLLYSFGGNGSLTRTFDVNSGVMGGIIADFANTTQMVHLGGDPAADTLLRVENSVNRIDALVPNVNAGSGWQFRDIIEVENLQDLNNPAVSAFAFSLGNLECFNPCLNGTNMPTGCSDQIDAVLSGNSACATDWGPSCVTTYSESNGNFCDLPAEQRQVNFGGMVIGVTGGSPSQLFLADPAYTFFGRAQVIGSTGNEARRVSCVATICGVTNYASNTLSIVQWDGLQNATIVDTVTVGAGPIGLSLREINGNVQILTTGEQANNYTLTEVDASGTVLSSTTTPVPSGCEAPSGILWLPDSDSAVISCTGSDAYAVIQP